jgi:3-oxoacyl-[acyl-carrier protein] reductase
MNAIDLKGRSAIVTGGARGIGLAIAERLLDSGAWCTLWDIDGAELVNAKRKLNGRGEVHTAIVDLSNPESVEVAAHATFSNFSRVDILVNNAGIAGVTKEALGDDARRMAARDRRESVLGVPLLSRRRSKND